MCREAGAAPGSLEVPKARLDRAWRAWDNGRCPCMAGGGTGWALRSFPLKYSEILMGFCSKGHNYHPHCSAVLILGGSAVWLPVCCEKASHPQCGRVVGPVHGAARREKNQIAYKYFTIFLKMLPSNCFPTITFCLHENNICQHEPQWQWGRIEWEKMRLSLDQYFICSIIIFWLGEVVQCPSKSHRLLVISLSPELFEEGWIPHGLKTPNH